jgi:hypothetical protein
VTGLHGISSPAWTLVPRVIAMRGCTLLIMLLCSSVLPGCGVLQTPGTTSDSWLTRARRQLAQVAKDIEADLDLHENEGLEAFDPKAAQQISAMRGEMNDAADMTH